MGFNSGFKGLSKSTRHSAPNIRVYYQWGFNTDHSDLEFSAAFLKRILISVLNYVLM